jgi:hypothetical protein
VTGSWALVTVFWALEICSDRGLVIFPGEYAKDTWACGMHGLGPTALGSEPTRDYAGQVSVMTEEIDE